MLKYLWKALRWAYGDTLKILGFLLASTAFVVLVMTFIAYPMQTILTVVIGGGIIILFMFFDEL